MDLYVWLYVLMGTVTLTGTVFGLCRGAAVAATGRRLQAMDDASALAESVAWQIRTLGVSFDDAYRLPAGWTRRELATGRDEEVELRQAKDAYVRGDIEIDEFEQLLNAILLT